MARGNRTDARRVPVDMTFFGRAARRGRLTGAASLLVGAMLFIGCASTAPNPSVAPGTTADPTPSPTDAAPSATDTAPSATPAAPTAAAPTATAAAPSATPGAVNLNGVPTACIGLGEQDCRRVIAHVAKLITADAPRIGYIQVGPFGCPGGQRCPTTLSARPEGEIVLESAGGARSFHVTASNGDLDARPQETFAVELPPTSQPQLLAGPQPLTLGHCGLFSGIDLAGSWWDPVGLVDYDHPDAINAAEGTFAPLGQDQAIFTSRSGFTVELIRRNGPKHLPLCD